MQTLDPYSAVRTTTMCPLKGFYFARSLLQAAYID